MTFRIGQEVVCIKEGPWMCDETMRPMEPGPTKGDVLVIVLIWPHDGQGFLMFSEYPRDAWDPDQFRPVVRTDISIFTAMLDKAPKREVENA